MKFRRLDDKELNSVKTRTNWWCYVHGWCLVLSSSKDFNIITRKSPMSMSAIPSYRRVSSQQSSFRFGGDSLFLPVPGGVDAGDLLLVRVAHDCRDLVFAL